MQFPNGFSILLRIELVFGGTGRPCAYGYGHVSVSSCGSSWFLGSPGCLGAPRRPRVSVSSCGSSWFLGLFAGQQHVLRLHVSVSSCGSSWFLGSMKRCMVSLSRCFSILLRIELVFGGRYPVLPQPLYWVSVSSCGSSWFLGFVRVPAPTPCRCVSVSSCGSSWFLGVNPQQHNASRPAVSVSSCGSSWFLGDDQLRRRRSSVVFQYPLADRVGFWGAFEPASTNTMASFSILLRIELVFGVRSRLARETGISVSVSSCGSSWFLGFPQAGISLILQAVSVSSCGSSWFLGAVCRAVRRGVNRVSVSSCGSSWFLGENAVFNPALYSAFQYPLADRVGFWGRDGSHPARSG